MSLLADLIDSLSKKLSEADSALKTTRESFLDWRRDADKEFHSVLRKPDSSEQDIFNARKKLHDEEMQKRKRELEPAYEKRDQIKKDLDSKIEWLNKGYEITVSPTTDAEEPETKKPSKPQTSAVLTAESGADGKSGKAGATGKAFTTLGYHGDLNGKSGKAGSDGKAGKSAKLKK